MKKFLVALMLCFVSIFSANAEKVLLSGWISQMMQINGYGNWETVIDRYGNLMGYGDQVMLTDEAIYVRFSHYTPEAFALQETSDLHYNNSGHQEITASAIDQDGVFCYLRIVFRDDPNCEAPLQIYVHYSNIDYVYNVVVTANHLSENSSGSNSGTQRTGYQGNSSRI